MTAPLLATGGTGNMGSRAVPLLRDAGRDLRILTRHPRPAEPGIQHVAGDTVAARDLVPGRLRFEPVHGDEVAARLAELALGAPAGLVGDLAGPEVLDVTQLVSTFLEVSGGRRRPRLPIRLPGAAGRASRAGENLAGATAQRGTGTWSQYLEQRERVAARP